MASSPSITLLIPCYNAADFLPRLMENVRAQTVPFAAVIGYDDGSKDETVAVARQLGIDIITGNPNRGVAHTRNALARAAQTEWIHFHDADDLISTEFVARLNPLCTSEADVVSCDTDWLDEKTRELLIPWRYEPTEMATASFPYLLSHAIGFNSSVIRRSCWQEIDGCDESLAIWEDADVHVRLARAGARFRHCPEVLAWALRRGESFSHDYRRGWTCRVTALERYANGPRANEVATVLAEQAENAAAELALLDVREISERALALCRRFGAHPPTTNHFLLRFLKPFFPAYSLLRWQAKRRRQIST